MLPHFINLLVRSWGALMKASSLSTFGFLLFSLLIPIVGGILGLAYYHFYEKQGWATAIKSALVPLFFTLIAVFIVISGAYFYRVVQTVYDDHQSFVKRTQELRQEQNGLVNPQNLEDEVADLKKQIGSYKAQQSPEVRIFPVSHDQQPGVPKMEYVLTTGKIRTPADITATCDFPISTGTARPMTVTGGFTGTMDNQRVSENQYRFVILSPDWSPSMPLYITIFFEGSVDRMPSCKFSVQ
jgi:hypothetical protein